ncbi:hypothetical protein Bca4012_101120 [Brassica carinata]
MVVSYVYPKPRVEIVCAKQVVGLCVRQAMMMLRNVPARANELVISDDEVAKRVVRTVTKSPSFAKSVSYSSSSLLCLYKGKCLSHYAGGQARLLAIALVQREAFANYGKLASRASARRQGLDGEKTRCLCPGPSASTRDRRCRSSKLFLDKARNLISAGYRHHICSLVKITTELTTTRPSALTRRELGIDGFFASLSLDLEIPSSSLEHRRDRSCRSDQVLRSSAIFLNPRTRSGRDTVNFTGGSRRRLHRRIETSSSPADRDGASPADRDGSFTGASMRIETTSSTRIFGFLVGQRELSDEFNTKLNLENQNEESDEKMHMEADYSSSSDSSSDDSDSEEEEGPLIVNPQPQPQPQPPRSTTTGGSRTLFAGNLALQVKKSDIKEFFQEAGEVVDVKFGMGRDDGSFRGFGHILFASPVEAQMALGFQGKTLLGLQIRLDMALESSETRKLCLSSLSLQFYAFKSNFDLTFSKPNQAMSDGDDNNLHRLVNS